MPRVRREHAAIVAPVPARVKPERTERVRREVAPTFADPVEALRYARARLDAGVPINRRQAAVLLGTSLRTLDRWIAAGRLPSPGGQYVAWPAQVFRPFIEQGPGRVGEFLKGTA